MDETLAGDNPAEAARWCKIVVVPLKQERIGMTIVWVLLGLSFVIGFIPFRHPSVWTIYAIGNIATIICLIHCSLWAGWRTALKMFALTFAIGYIAEFIGVRMRSESTFGGYHYTEVLNGPLVFGVPPITMIDYFALGYPAYVMARVIAGNEFRRISALKSLGVAVLAALIMVTHDLSVDPTQATVRKLWIWEGGGAYFGVPLHNFVDWFFVTSIFLFLYRFLTSTSGAMEFIAMKTERRFYLPPILVYLAFSLPVMLSPLLHGETEISLSMSGVAMFATTIPVLAAVLALYRDDRQAVTTERPASSEVVRSGN